jgi:hypothetical protein
MSQPVNAAPAGEFPQQGDLSRPPAANRHRLPDEREFSAGLRKSEAVPLGDPVVPVLDGFVG